MKAQNLRMKNISRFIVIKIAAFVKNKTIDQKA